MRRKPEGLRRKEFPLMYCKIDAHWANPKPKKPLHEAMEPKRPQKKFGEISHRVSSKLPFQKQPLALFADQAESAVIAPAVHAERH